VNIGPEANDRAMVVASSFVRFLAQACPAWDLGFFRFALSEAGPAASASCVTGTEVAVLDHPGAFEVLVERSKALFDAIGRTRGVVLFVLGASGNCEIRFDLEDLERWKLDAGTGVPRGL